MYCFSPFGICSNYYDGPGDYAQIFTIDGNQVQNVGLFFPCDLKTLWPMTDTILA